MDRTQWRKERRLWNEVQTDVMYARQYDKQWGSNINPSHRDMLERFLDLCPQGGFPARRSVWDRKILASSQHADFRCMGRIIRSTCFSLLKPSFQG